MEPDEIDPRLGYPTVPDGEVIFDETEPNDENTVTDDDRGTPN